MQIMRDVCQNRSHNESKLVSDHYRAIHCLAKASHHPPNIVQGEFVQLANFMSQIFPVFVNAATLSDLPRMQEAIDVGKDLLESMQVLVNYEAEARETVNNKREMLDI